jgi:hypothetical protein
MRVTSKNCRQTCGRKIRTEHRRARWHVAPRHAPRIGATLSRDATTDLHHGLLGGARTPEASTRHFTDFGNLFPRHTRGGQHDSLGQSVPAADRDV